MLVVGDWRLAGTRGATGQRRIRGSAVGESQEGGVMRVINVLLQQFVAAMLVVPLLVVVMACVPFYAVWACLVDDDGLEEL